MGELARVQGTGTAEGGEREVTWVIAAFPQRHTDRAVHRRVDDGQHTCRCIVGCEAERLSQPVGNRLLREVGTQVESPGQAVWATTGRGLRARR